MFGSPPDILSLYLAFALVLVLVLFLCSEKEKTKKWEEEKKRNGDLDGLKATEENNKNKLGQAMPAASFFN